MRGADISQPKLFVTKTVEDFVPMDHPLRALRMLVDEALGKLNELFDAIDADEGRDSVAPERLMRASLLLRDGAGDGAQAQVAVGGAFQRGRHADRRLGLAQELPAQGRR